MKVVGIIQCRMSSSRLPGKAMMDLLGKPLLQRVIENVQKAKSLDEFWVATSTGSEDDVIQTLCDRLHIPCYRGSLNDVRSRFVAVAEKTNATHIARVTADNPLTEPVFIDQMVTKIKQDLNLEYVVMSKEKIPFGTGTEIFSVRAMLDSVRKSTAAEDQEHVTPTVQKLVKVTELDPAVEFELSPERLTVDTVEDFQKVLSIYKMYPQSGNILRDYIADQLRKKKT